MSYIHTLHRNDQVTAPSLSNSDLVEKLKISEKQKRQNKNGQTNKKVMDEINLFKVKDKI